MMKRMKAVISYDGSGFAGYQVQPGHRTVQLELEKVLTSMHKGTLVRVSASGRTDAGVHAIGQVIHFDTSLSIPEDRWQKALNVQLPADIRVMSVEEAPEGFHARFSATGKVYRYKWSLTPVHSPFERFHTTHVTYPLDIARMREAAAYFIGTYDFTSFCSAKAEVEDRVRTIHRLEFERHGDQLHLVIQGNGFLYNMVRIIAGTLFDIGIGKKDPTDIPGILEEKDRRAAGKTAPAQGLYLEKVIYGK
ncbi:tRNA pseudouridine(38-40) synthase TruA [Chungangia koreensis]|uniref:tRNA pseudouridine synthase A n=1 Tax=Chungangia koreensis TaxID=752657 RepID=A0ABV8X7M8_9LACT